METLAKIARFGDRLLSVVGLVLALLILTYGGYSLWDNMMTYQRAFVSEDLLKYKPNTEEEDSLSLQELKAVNEDVWAWLTVDDTHIDYPVVKGESNLEYLNKDVYGNFALGGSIFMDSLNKEDFSDQYTLLFGHHMENGAMFGDIVYFLEQDYFNRHQTGTLYLNNKAYKLTLFSCLETEGSDVTIYNTSAQKSEDMEKLFSYLKTESSIYRDIGLRSTDKIVGLSTCAEAATNGRIVLFGKMEEIEVKQAGL